LVELVLFQLHDYPPGVSFLPCDSIFPVSRMGIADDFAI